MAEETKRRSYMVHKEFQRKMILRVILLVIAATLITNGIVYGLLAYQQRKANDLLFVVNKEPVAAEDLPVVTRTSIVKPAIISSLLITDAVSILLISFFVLLYSNRIAGPVYRIQKGLEQVRDGNYDIDVQLRQGDEFKELADSLNSMAKALKERGK